MTSIAANLSDALAPHAAAIAESILGEPTARHRGELRFRSRGSLSVTIAGPHAGKWRDYEAGTHGDMLDLIAAFAVQGKGFGAAAAWASAWLGGSHPAPLSRREPKPATPLPTDGQRTGLARHIWKQAQPIPGTLAETYLRRRGIALAEEVPDLRFHPNTRRDKETVPAMVAAVHCIHSDEVQAIHRTFLAPDGSKAPGQDPKRMLGPVAGAVVKLTPDEEVTHGLSIVEGIETGVTLLTWGLAPVWCCLSASGIAAFPVLGGVEVLTIYADHDTAGMTAAETCAERWRDAGREVEIVTPPQPGTDWADLAGRNAA